MYRSETNSDNPIHSFSTNINDDIIGPFLLSSVSLCVDKYNELLADGVFIVNAIYAPKPIFNLDCEEFKAELFDDLCVRACNVDILLWECSSLSRDAPGSMIGS